MEYVLKNTYIIHVCFTFEKCKFVIYIIFYGDFSPFFTILYSLNEHVVLFTDIAILKVYTM